MFMAGDSVIASNAALAIDQIASLVSAHASNSGGRPPTRPFASRRAHPGIIAPRCRPGIYQYWYQGQ